MLAFDLYRLRALLAADWRVTGGVLKIARRIWEVGVAGSQVMDSGNYGHPVE